MLRRLHLPRDRHIHDLIGVLDLGRLHRPLPVLLPALLARPRETIGAACGRWVEMTGTFITLDDHTFYLLGALCVPRSNGPYRIGT